MATSFKKDPDATLDYTVDWTEWLSAIADTITSSVWIADPSLVVVSNYFAGGKATAFISGGVLETSVVITNRITTVGGRTDDRSITLKIASR